MGEVHVQLQLENFFDREMVRRGLLAEDQVHTLTTSAVVDTDVLMLMLPQTQVNALSLNLSDSSAVTVKVGNRSATVTFAVNPDSAQTVLGRLPLTILDLHWDEARQTLLPRPESPLLPMYRI